MNKFQMNAIKLLTKLLFFNLLLIFIYPSFGSENFDECTLLTSEIKKNIHSDQLDEAPNEINADGHPVLWFKTDTKYNSSSSNIKKIGHIDGVTSEDVNVFDFPYERTSRNMIKILSIHSYYSIKYKIKAGDIVYSINNLKTSNLADSEIRNLIIEEMEILKEENNTELKIFNNKEDLKTEYFSVSAGIFPKTISDIDPVSGTFNSSYKIVIEWADDRLKNIGQNIYEDRNKNFPELKGYTYFCTYTEKEFFDLGLWQPQIGLKNEIRNLNMSKKNYIIEFFHEDSDANGMYITKKYEGASNLKSNFIFNSFPFDSQKLEFVLNDISADKYNHYIWYSEAYYLDLIRNFNNISLTDWTLASFDFNHTSDPSFLWEQQYSATANKENLHFIYSIERNYFYYIYKILIPIIIILLISWSTFWISIKELESRLTVSVVCFLSLIAYTFVIDQSLPKLDYLTIMDKIILLAYVFSALPTMQSIYIHSLYKNNQSKSVVINSRFKKMTPVLFFLITLFIIVIVLYDNKNTIHALTY